MCAALDQHQAAALTYRQELPCLDACFHHQLLQLQVLLRVAGEPKATEHVLPQPPLLLLLGLLLRLLVVWLDAERVFPVLLLDCQLMLLLLVEAQLQCRHRGQRHRQVEQQEEVRQVLHRV